MSEWVCIMCIFESTCSSWLIHSHLWTSHILIQRCTCVCISESKCDSFMNEWMSHELIHRCSGSSFRCLCLNVTHSWMSEWVTNWFTDAPALLFEVSVGLDSHWVSWWDLRCRLFYRALLQKRPIWRFLLVSIVTKSLCDISEVSLWHLRCLFTFFLPRDKSPRDVWGGYD